MSSLTHYIVGCQTRHVTRLYTLYKNITDVNVTCTTALPARLENSAAISNGAGVRILGGGGGAIKIKIKDVAIFIECELWPVFAEVEEIIS